MPPDNHRPAALLIHGFTGHRSSLEPLIPELEKRGIDWQYPILAGHGTKPQDLSHKRWTDWQNDVEAGYRQLRLTHDHVVVVALSMGTLLAMELATTHPDHISGLVLLSPCIQFQNLLAPLTPFITPFIKRFPFPPRNKFSSAEYAKRDRGYPWFPTAAYKSYWQQAKTIDQIIGDIHCPVRIIQSHNDRVAKPAGAQRVFDLLTSPKELLWHDRSGHEMLLDCEAESVLQEILHFSPFAQQES